MIVLSAPTKVGLDITNRCNLECLHCHANANTLPGPYLSTEKILALISELAAMKIFTLQIGGGEPFIHPEIMAILKHAVKYDFNVVMSTNGTLITKERAHELKTMGINSLQISLDGATAEVHDKFRGIPGAFDLALKGIDNLRDADVKVNIACTLSKFNCHQIADFVELAYQHGAESFRTMCLMPAGRGLDHLNLILKNSELLAVISQLKKSRTQYKNKIDISYETPFIVKKQSIPSKKELDPVDAYFVGCEAGKRECRILPNGNVVPCPLFGNNPDYIAGNVLRQPFSDIWYNSKVFEKFRLLNVGEKNGKCKKCEFGYICNGGCPAVAQNCANDFYAPDPRCEYIPGSKEFIKTE